MSDEFKVQINLKYGQTLINIRGGSVAEAAQEFGFFIGEPIADVDSLIDVVTKTTKILHDAERANGLYVEPSFRGGGGRSQGGGSGVPKPPGVPANEVTREGQLPFPEGTLSTVPGGPGPCPNGNARVMAWSTPSTKQGPRHGKSFPVWQDQCQPRQFDHGIWVRDS